MREDFHTTDVLANRLTEVCRRYPAVEPQMVAEILRIVLDGVSGQLSAHEAPIGKIGAAGSELAAVVSHTAAATAAILDACEVLTQEAGRMPGVTGATLEAATTQIYEACSFQDITGQRLTKVMATLRAVEGKVDRIVATFGQERWATKHEHSGEIAGLTGPQLPSAALVQADIDALLACYQHDPC